MYARKPCGGNTELLLVGRQALALPLFLSSKKVSSKVPVSIVLNEIERRGSCSQLAVVVR